MGKNFGEFPDRFKISVSCASGVESVLKKEIFRLCGVDAPAINGRIEIDGDPELLAKCNLRLRTADRVYIKVAEFSAVSFDDIFDGVKAVGWENFITKDAAVVVDGRCVKSKIFAVSDSQRIVKRAIADRLCAYYGINRLSECAAEYKIFFYLFKDVLSLYIDASGTGLNKRGYRDRVGIAPIKETLAAAMLLMSDFYKTRPFCDPFCGSGTFLIESAFIAYNIAPGLHRRFAFTEWENFDRRYYERAAEECVDLENRNVKLDIRGFDVDKKAVELSERHIARAGLKGAVTVKVQPVKKLALWADAGTVVTNPPYGDRIYGRKDAEECYKDLGAAFCGHEGWSLFAITDDRGFERAFGRKCDRKRKLYNSEKECDLYFYYGKKEK